MRSLNKLKGDGWETSTVEVFAKEYPFLEKYMKYLNWEGNKVSVFVEHKEGETTYMLLLYTEKREYQIIVTPTYMGCQTECRYCRPLEDWTRGRDLADGKCNEETFGRILCDIISTELVSL